MPTGRDRVWSTALRLIESGSDGFDAREVWRLMREIYDDDDKVPSKQTVRNALDAMDDLGHLTSIGGGGRSFRVYREPRTD